MLKILQGAIAIPLPSNPSEDYLPNHAHPVAVPVQTTSLAWGLSGSRGQWSLWHPPSFHELIPRFWIHQAWRPLAP
jgi:hypothetical protein